VQAELTPPEIGCPVVLPPAVDENVPTDAREFNLWSKVLLGNYEKAVEIIVEVANCLEDYRKKGIIR
jgi:hypothetical protein